MVGLCGWVGAVGGWAGRAGWAVWALAGWALCEQLSACVSPAWAVPTLGGCGPGVAWVACVLWAVGLSRLGAACLEAG